MRRQPIGLHLVGGDIRAQIGAVGVPLQGERLAFAREMHIVQTVVAELEEVLAEVVLRIHQVRVAPARTGRTVEAVVTRANLAPAAEIAAEINVGFRFTVAKARDLDIVAVDRQIVRLDARARRHEPGPRRRERLIEFAEHLRVAADLHIRQQFRAELVDFSQYESGRRVVVAVALEIVLQIQAEAQVIRTPGFAPRPHFDAGILSPAALPAAAVPAAAAAPAVAAEPRRAPPAGAARRRRTARGAGVFRGSRLLHQAVVEGLEIPQAV